MKTVKFTDDEFKALLRLFRSKFLEELSFDAKMNHNLNMAHQTLECVAKEGEQMRCRICDTTLGYDSREDFVANNKDICDSCKDLFDASLLENCQDYIECMGSWGGSGSMERANIHGAISLKLKVRHGDKQLREITDNLDKYLDWSNFVLNEYMVNRYGKKLYDLLIKTFNLKEANK